MDGCTQIPGAGAAARRESAGNAAVIARIVSIMAGLTLP